MKISEQEFIDKYRKAEDPKPCPFCGGIPTIDGNALTASWVYCPCGCTLKVEFPNQYTDEENEELDDIERIFDCESMVAITIYHCLIALTKWNERVSTP